MDWTNDEDRAMAVYRGEAPWDRPTGLTEDEQNERRMEERAMDDLIVPRYVGESESQAARRRALDEEALGGLMSVRETLTTGHLEASRKEAFEALRRMLTALMRNERAWREQP
jgi:hypothetical protein